MRLLAVVSCLLASLAVEAGELAINAVRLWSAPDHTRLVFDTTGPVAHKIFTLKNPDRLVIDLQRTRLRTRIPAPGKDERVIRRVRSAPRDGGGLRVVLDLKRRAHPKSFLLRPNREYGHRLVVDLDLEQVKKTVKSHGPRKDIAAGAKPRDIVIAIDAGHGGEDPGARGASGTFEKDVVLAIARKLATLIRAEPGMRPVLIRDGDYFIKLRNRMRKARRHKADLFVSIHADAFRDRRVRGASVYTLSRRGASSEAARWLAERENTADLIGGVKLEDKDDLLASVLLDLSQRATLQASTEAADKVLARLRRLGKTHKRHVQQAGFVVLKSPDVPSMLVETAFISNAAEERRLRDTGYQQKLAKALLAGIRDYFRHTPPAGTLLAQLRSREHVISRGETLSTIAQRYSVSLRHLRSANKLSGDHIRAGQVLRIPGS